MSASVLASLLPPSNALPHRHSSAAQSEARVTQGGFDSVLADLDQQGAPKVEATGEPAAAASPQHAEAPTALESSTSTPAKTTTNVDAALSIWGALAFPASAATAAAKSSETTGASADPKAATSTPADTASKPTTVSSSRRAATSASPTSIAASTDVETALSWLGTQAFPAAATTGGATAPNVAAAKTQGEASPRGADASTNPASPATSPAKTATTVDATRPRLGTLALPASAADATGNFPQALGAHSAARTSTALPNQAYAAAQRAAGGGANLASVSLAEPLASAADVWPTISSASAKVLDTSSAAATPAQISPDLPTRAPSATPTQIEPAVPTHASSTTPTPGADAGGIAYATKATLSFAPELNLQSLQSKTYLAVSGAASAAIAGSQGLKPSAAVASTPRPQPSAQREGSTSRKSTAVAATSTMANAQTPSSAVTDVAPIPQGASRRDPSASQASGRETIGAASPEAETTSPSAATASALAPVATGSSKFAPASVSLDDLGDRLSSEAQTLTQPTSASNPSVASAPIKQLELNLEPAHLGAVAVTLKLTNGKLSVDVGVANSHTLAEVEGQRDAIVSKLQAGAQPLESFVVHQQVFSDASANHTSAHSSQTASFDNASGDRAASQEPRDKASRQPRTPPPPANGASTRGSLRSDLVV